MSVRSQVLPFRLKSVGDKEDAYPNLIVHSAYKRPQHLIVTWSTLGPLSWDNCCQYPGQQSPSEQLLLLRMELVTLFLIQLVGPQALPLHLNPNDDREGAYPSLIVHLAHKHSRHSTVTWPTLGPSPWDNCC
ncbi:Uncharacterized protein TCM_046168 [Theobroma cacao]|uniref:Uncharacterized protein n=1 Tax=Theobroma cacao TaxID=3641 RepID=S1S492_THECC|nr:Uncharacterized protein TCM_046168 [Theobroma cacao]